METNQNFDSVQRNPCTEMRILEGAMMDRTKFKPSKPNYKGLEQYRRQQAAIGNILAASPKRTRAESIAYHTAADTAANEAGLARAEQAKQAASVLDRTRFSTIVKYGDIDPHSKGIKS
jgi:hypothetical protein